MHTEVWKYSGEKFPEVSPELNPTRATNSAYDLPLRTSLGAEYVTITPAIAKHWLSTFNVTNRNLRPKKLERYVNALLSGRWKVNGESIKFGYGKVIDGQHRLLAIVVSGVKAKSLVTFGLDVAVQDTVDTGANRTAADVLGIEGLDGWEAATLGGAIHTLLNYDRGGLPITEKQYDNAEAKSFFLEHAPKIVSSLKHVRTLVRRPALLPYSMMAALHYIFSNTTGEDAREDADRFFVALVDGIGLTPSSPILFLRNRLIADLSATNRKPRSKYQLTGMVVRAWNAYRRGAVWRGPSGLSMGENETFPQIA